MLHDLEASMKKIQTFSVPDGVRREDLLYVLSSRALQFVAKGPQKIFCRCVDEVFLLESFTVLCSSFF